MADQTRTFRIEFVGDATSATKSMQSMEEHGGRVQRAMSSLGDELKKRFVVTAGDVAGAVRGAVDVMRDMVGAAMEDAQGQTNLATQLRNSSGAITDQIADAENYIQTLQRATGVLDDELRPALAQLVRATGDVAGGQDLLNLALDISAATGRDLGTISIALAKAYAGNTQGLTRLGIVMKDSEGKALDWKAAQEKLNATFGGAAAAAADTTAGKMRILNAQWQETKETIGGIVIPILDDLARKFIWVGDNMSDLNDKTGGWLGHIIEVLGSTDPFEKPKKSVIDLTHATGKSSEELVSMFKKAGLGSTEAKNKFYDLALTSENTAARVIQGMKDAGLNTDNFTGILERSRKENRQAAIDAGFASDEIDNETESTKKATAEETKRADSLAYLATVYGDLLVGIVGFSRESDDIVNGMAEELQTLSKSIQEAVPTISDAFSAAGEAASGAKEKTVVSVQDMKKALDQQVSDSAKWAADIKKLIALGVDYGIVAELAAAGPKMLPEVEATLGVVEKYGKDAVNGTRKAVQEDAAVVTGALAGMRIQAEKDTGMISLWMSQWANRLAPSGDLGAIYNNWYNNMSTNRSLWSKTNGGMLEQHALGGSFQGAAIVGEFGPEIVVGAGTVIPNDKAFGGGPTTIVMELDGRIIGQVVVDLSKRTGGLPIRIKAGA